MLWNTRSGFHRDAACACFCLSGLCWSPRTLCPALQLPLWYAISVPQRPAASATVAIASTASAVWVFFCMCAVQEPAYKPWITLATTVMCQKYGSPSTPPSSTPINTYLSNTYNMPPQRSFGTEISGNRRLNRELSIDERNSIISKYKASTATCELVVEFLVTPKYIRDILRRYRETSSNSNRPSRRRPPILIRREI
jgi:hypothetical protein